MVQADPSDLQIPGYRIVKAIGTGPSASVYLAEAEFQSDPVALKVLDHSAGAAQYLRQFAADSTPGLAVRHPNLVAIHQVGTADGLLYVAMEYAQRGSLTSHLGRRIPPAAALKLSETMARALHVLHRADVVHGDVKPSNILFREDRTPVLADYVMVSGSDDPPNNAEYLSPEQALGHTIDGRSDIYSLGVILCELLMGDNPYHADDATTTTLNHLSQPVPKLPEGLEVLQPLLNRMLADRPEDRFNDTAALVNFIATLRQSGLLALFKDHDAA